jgi:aspartyl aminopeptidase
MIAGHIDALTARLKPTSTKPNRDGYVQLGVAQYAGALNETWWDRDLSIGGRVIVRDPETGKTTVKLVKLDWPSASHSALPAKSSTPSADHFQLPASPPWRLTSASA